MREAESITTQKDFIEYLTELRANLSKHPDQWENLSLDAFLDAMGRWVEDSGFAPPPHAWTAVACLLRAGRGYE